MKNFKIVLIIIVMLGGLSYASAQRKVVKVYPKRGTVVTTLHQPKLIVHNKVNFHFSNGVWYKARGRKYVVCAAPVGIKVRKLPRGNKIVHVNGRKLYKYKGIWYKKRGRAFVVVNV